MKLRIVTVGGGAVAGRRVTSAAKGAPEQALCAEYLARLARYCKVEEVVVAPDTPAREAAGIRKACAGTSVVLLDERGTTLTSDKLARKVEGLAARGKGEVAFVIGGAHGLPSGLDATLREGPDGAASVERWCLSALTFPHRLARVVLCEQLYRAMTILRGEPYHH